ncbi:unnamed protein product, partial [marine sediment metagenome]
RGDLSGRVKVAVICSILIDCKIKRKYYGLEINKVKR